MLRLTPANRPDSSIQQSRATRPQFHVSSRGMAKKGGPAGCALAVIALATCRQHKHAHDTAKGCPHPVPPSGSTRSAGAACDSWRRCRRCDGASMCAFSLSQENTVARVLVRRATCYPHIRPCAITNTQPQLRVHQAAVGSHTRVQDAVSPATTNPGDPVLA